MIDFMEFEVDCSRSRGMSWLEVVQKDCQAHELSRDDAVVWGRWRKLLSDG